MSREPLDRTGQSWEVTGRDSRRDGHAFVVTRTEPKLKYGLFEIHHCLSILVGETWMLSEAADCRWELSSYMRRIA